MKFLPNNILLRASKFTTKNVLNLFKGEKPQEIPTQSVELASESRIEAKGLSMPIIGLGTWQIEPALIDSCLSYAIETGYRHIDTAYSYGNEIAIGYYLAGALRSGFVKRDELFITSKLPFYGMTPEGVKYHLEESLKNLKLSYLDLYLIHFPVGVRMIDDAYTPDPDSNIIKVWQTMEGYVRNGKVKNLGVSNFNVDQVKTILDAAKVAPANVQVELHLYHQQRDMWKFCGENSISLTAYAPLGSPSLTNFLLAHDLNISDVPLPLKNQQVLNIARKHKKTAAQVLLRYLIQNGIAVIPKSQSPDRIVSNFDIFDFSLNDSELDELEALDMRDKGRMFANIWEGTESHKDYPYQINENRHPE